MESPCLGVSLQIHLSHASAATAAHEKETVERIAEDDKDDKDDEDDMTCHEIWMNFASFYRVKNDSPRFTNTEWRDFCSYFVHTLEAQKQISKSLWKTCAESSLPWEASLFPNFPQPTHSPQASPGSKSSTACDGALASRWAVGGVVGIGTCYFQPLHDEPNKRADETCPLGPTQSSVTDCNCGFSCSDSLLSAARQDCNFG